MKFPLLLVLYETVQGNPERQRPLKAPPFAETPALPPRRKDGAKHEKSLPKLNLKGNEVSFIRRGRYFYAAALIAGTAPYVPIEELVGREVAANVGMATIGGLCLGSIIDEWDLPILKRDDCESP